MSGYDFLVPSFLEVQKACQEMADGIAKSMQEDLVLTVEERAEKYRKQREEARVRWEARRAEMALKVAESPMVEVPLIVLNELTDGYGNDCPYNTAIIDAWREGSVQ